MNNENPCPSAPPEKLSKDGKMRKVLKFSEELESQKQALQNLDQMVKDIYENELPGMCCMPTNQMSNSRSDGFIHNICRWVLLVIIFVKF